MKRLEKANQYQREKTARGSDRPVYHFTPPTGWLNDPNGFSYYQGKIHLFYQYHPFSDSWGLMFWGHAVSNDFVSWEDLPVALAPDEPYDSGGVFSGSGIVVGDKQMLIYTGSVKQRNNPDAKIVLQQQCLAEGDGLTYTKYDHNPVIGRDQLPEGFLPAEFRDPKVIEYNGTYYVVTVAMAEDGSGHVLFYSSPDLKEWTYLGILAGSHEGQMWECPDFFQINGIDLLIVSPIEMPDKVDAEKRIGPFILSGSMDWNTYRFSQKDMERLDWGSDFYAPQTMEMPDGRRIMIAWMQAWNNYIKPKPQKWHGIMTYPRELSVEDGRLMQSPAREILSCRQNPVVRENVEITGQQRFDGIEGRVLDLTVTVKEVQGNFSIGFANGEAPGILFTWNPEESILYFKRQKPEDSVSKVDVFGSQKMQIKGKLPLKLRFMIDTCTAELFVNDGSQVFSSTYYAPLDAQDVVFEAQGKALVDIEKYSIVPQE